MNSRLNKVTSAILLTLIISLTLFQSGAAQNNSLAQQEKGEPERGYNPETGRLAFIGGDTPIVVESLSGQALRELSPEQQAMEVAKIYAPEFGVQYPVRELQAINTRSVGTRRSVTRYQQTYQGIPILAGEMIVNLDDSGRLLSMSGEVSPKLSLDTTPVISAEEAHETALGVMARQYQEEPSAFEATEPELWIFDESLLKSSTRATELVWRMDVSAVDIGTPVREMVLVNAHTGGVSLHFNQIDTAWNNTESKTEQQQTSNTWYVSTTGDDANDCLTAITPCATINGAIAKAVNGDTINVTSGSYIATGNEVVKIDKDIVLYGGWNSDFSEQTGYSTLNGENTRRGITVGKDCGCTPQQAVNTIIDHFEINNGNGPSSGYFSGSAAAILGDHHGNITIQNSSIHNNENDASGAGVIYSYYGKRVTLVNSTIGNNGGSGLQAWMTNGIYLRNATIANNYQSGGAGGGIDFRANPFRTNSLEIQNTIIANNSSPTSPDCYTKDIAVSSSGYNLIENVTGCNFSATTGDITGVDPKLSAFVTSSGVFQPTPGSPVIDAGNPATPGSGGNACEATDQLSTSRPIDGSEDTIAICDIGAYETDPPAPPVATSIDVSNGSDQIAVTSTAFANHLAALVKDQYGLPSAGATVTFTAPASGASGTFSDTATHQMIATTDSNGLATASTFTANGTIGSYLIEASASGVVTTANYQLENIIPSPTTIIVQSGSDQNTQINTSFSEPLIALVKDQLGDPVSGVTVTFTAPASGASSVFSDSGTNISTADTDANGVATSATFTANSIGGNYIIEAASTEIATPAEFQTKNSIPWYVSTAGNDSNNCLSPTAPCATLATTIGKSGANDMIYVTKGIYTIPSTLSISEDLTLSGGWDNSFTSQTGFTRIDGIDNTYNGFNIDNSNVSLSRFIIENSNYGIRHVGGNLYFTQGALINNRNGLSNSGNGDVFLINVTISGNTPLGTVGSAISNGSGTVDIRSSTITNNHGNYNWTIYSVNSSAFIEIRNTILAGNNTGYGDCYVSVTSENMISHGYNIFDSSPVCYGSSKFTPDLSDMVGIDPKLGALLSEGYHPLLPDSPAIDAGNPAIPGTGSTACEATDQLGRARPIDGDNDTVAICDIGAYETNIPTSATATYVEVSNGSPQFTALNTSFGNPLIVKVRDQYGLPFAGADVIFTAPDNGASGIFSDTLAQQTIATTNSNGLATASTLTANNTEGLYLVNATVSGAGTSAQFKLENYAPSPTTLSVNNGSHQEAITYAEYQNPLSVLLVDQKDQPMQGATVMFTAPSSGASGLFNDSGTITTIAITDANGIATSATFTANATEGAYIVDATVSGIGTPTEFQLENYVPTPTTITYHSGGYQSTTIYTAFYASLEALVSDQFGNPMQDTTVTFTAAPSNSVSPSGAFSDTGTKTTSAITDENGIATSSTFVANGNLGVHYVGATVNGLTNTISFRFENKLGVKILTHTMNHNSSILPGTFLCGETHPECTIGTNPDADLAHEYAFDTYLYYFSEHGRHSIDNSGMKITSSVQYDTNYENAFWNSEQMVYGDNMVTDDIAAHEMTHGVTQYESNLIYLYQSGAINEAFSDLWGEFIDQTNGAGNDSEAVKWLIGEDLAGGAGRSMRNPPAYGDPDKMTSPLFHTSMSDNGGVHHNSGINNKAVYLMVEGGSFNGKTISGIGIDKTAAIYYEVQTNLLGAGANYTDLYYALQQACSNLIGGAEGITTNDCAQVRNAAQAVEMHIKPSQSYTAMPDACPTGLSESYIFFDDLEHGTTNWGSGVLSGNNVWSLTSIGISSPGHSIFGQNIPSISDSYIAMTSDLSLPANSSYKLFFKHLFGLEGYYDQNDNLIEAYDGGIVEYSTNQGATWKDANSLFSAGQNYNAQLETGAGNPLQGRYAFSGVSHGMVGSLYDLSSLSGKNVRFRWRLGSDAYISSTGWFIDDISVYQCESLPIVSSITRADTDPTNASTVHFTVSFNRSMTGVDITDFSLATTGVSGALVSNVSGSGKIYTITVDTGTGDGTIQLNLIDDDSIIDGNSIPLGGVGTGNANFTSGEFYTILPPPPDNDDFDSAIPLALSSIETKETRGATQNPDDPATPQCNINDGGRVTVWYKYSPSTDTAIALDTETADYDTFIAVWTGTRNNLTLVACNDDANGTKQSALAFQVVGGTTYYIEVGQP